MHYGLVFLTQHFPWRHDIPKGTKKGVEQNQQKKQTNRQTTWNNTTSCMTFLLRMYYTVAVNRSIFLFTTHEQHERIEL